MEQVQELGQDLRSLAGIRYQGKIFVHIPAGAIKY